MIFVDANVLMYAVGAQSPVRNEVRRRLRQPTESLATSTEVLQELLHRYVRSRRWDAHDAALLYAKDLMTIWPVTLADISLARDLEQRHPDLSGRDLTHLATCMNRDIEDLWTYDRGLKDAWSQR